MNIHDQQRADELAQLQNVGIVGLDDTLQAIFDIDFNHIAHDCLFLYVPSDEAAKQLQSYLTFWVNPVISCLIHSAGCYVYDTHFGGYRKIFSILSQLTEEVSWLNKGLNKLRSYIQDPNQLSIFDTVE